LGCWWRPEVGSVGGGAVTADGGGGSGHLHSTRITASNSIPGNQTMPNPTGGNQTGHGGNGFARITFLEVVIPTQAEEVEVEYTESEQPENTPEINNENEDVGVDDSVQPEEEYIDEYVEEETNIEEQAKKPETRHVTIANIFNFKFS